MKLLIIAGARPNFMKIAPIIRAIQISSNTNEKAINFKLVHTGQHYDYSMSQGFFEELGIPDPDINLNIGSGSHAVQTANIMIKFEEVCLKEKPDIILIVGDVNSTLACAIVGKKLNIKVAHVEAGLRSEDKTMPEEINRIVSDSISDTFFVTEKQGVHNLIKEGHDMQSIHFVGNVMIDNLFYNISNLENAKLSISSLLKNKVKKNYASMTMHRPSNVDDENELIRFIKLFGKISEKIPIIFPCHPRTRQKLHEAGLLDKFIIDYNNLDSIDNGIVLTEPLMYFEFINLWKNSKFVITDSGGLQEETTALKVPCITIRENTERPITVDVGSNVIVGNDEETILRYVDDALNGKWKESRIPELWDGKASERIVEILLNSYN